MAIKWASPSASRPLPLATAERSSIHVGESGSGPVVVLLHGVPSAPSDFEPLVTALSSRHRVLVPHLPSYGRSPADPVPSTLEQIVVRLEDRLLEVGATEVAFAAFSGGAYKAVSVALRRRVLVSRLVLFAPVVGLDPVDAQAYRDIAAATRGGHFDPRSSWLDRMASPSFLSNDPEGAARVMSWLDAAPLSVICDELDAAAAAPDLRPRLSEVTCSTLIVTGSADRAVPTAGVAAVAGAFPNVNFVQLESVGHALLLEAPARVVTLMGDFLSGRAVPDGQ